MKVAGDNITKRLQSVRCPVHGQPANVVKKGTDEKPEWEVSGCCKEFVDRGEGVVQEVKPSKEPRI